VILVVFAGECSLSTLFAHDPILLRGQLGLPFGFGFFNFLDHIPSLACDSVICSGIAIQNANRRGSSRKPLQISHSAATERSFSFSIILIAYAAETKWLPSSLLRVPLFYKIMVANLAIVVGVSVSNALVGERSRFSFSLPQWRNQMQRG
jgi:hypothetical protein